MATNLKEKKDRKKSGFAMKGKMGLRTSAKVRVQSRVMVKKTLKVGDICMLNITAVAPGGFGIDEYSYPYAVFVPNAQYGDKVKAKIRKIEKMKGGSASTFALAELISKKSLTAKTENVLPVKPGSVLEVTITKQSKRNPGVGIADYSSNYKIIVPLSSLNGNMTENENDVSSRHTNTMLLPKKVKVTVTRVKAKYAFATVVDTVESTPKKTTTLKGRYTMGKTNPFVPGSKFTTVLPANSKSYGKYFIVKVQGKLLFVKKEKGLVLGGKVSPTKVRIKIVTKSTTSNLLIGKILKVNPVSQVKKSTLVMNSIREMIAHGMHFGEKAVKCHARMKPYLWTEKATGRTKLQTSSWTPQGFRMSRSNSDKPLIKKGRHIINPLKARRCLNKSLNTLTKYALKGRTFLFIGTKKPATGLVMRAAHFTKNSFYVNTRWLGGMLTNWKTICKSISKIRPILKEKQKVVRDILERRQTIKSRLIKKALLLKKKSKLILTKGRALLEGFKNETYKTQMFTKVKNLAAKRQFLLSKGIKEKKKYQILQAKRRELIYQTLLLKEKGLQISSKYNVALTQFSIYTKKLRLYKILLTLGKEIKTLQKTNGSLYTVPFNILKKEMTNLNNQQWIIPNPPKEILNRIVGVQKGKEEFILTNSKNENALSSKAPRSKNTQTKGSVIVCSSLLLRFAHGFSSYIKTVIKTLISTIKTLYTQCQNFSTKLNTIKTTLESYSSLKKQYDTELQLLKGYRENERRVIQIVKRQLKALDCQKKFIKFLPRLRYLPLQTTKISSIVRILLSKIVDPKLKYPIDIIYEKKAFSSSKKVAAARKKKWQRLEKYFGGIANMTKLSKTTKRANIVAIIIGQKEEMNAVRECQKLGIKTFTIVDTNCDPTLSNHIIPANDDSRNSIKYVLNKFISRIVLARKIRNIQNKLKKN